MIIAPQFYFTMSLHLRLSEGAAESIETYQLLVFTDDVNLLGEKFAINKIQKKIHYTRVRRIFLEATAQQEKYKFIPHQQDTGIFIIQKYLNNSFENVAKFKFLDVQQQTKVVLRKKTSSTQI
jgi:hypothetical protein